MNKVLLMLVFCFVCFAIRSEKVEYNDAYIKHKPNIKDDYNTIIQKIENSLDYDLKTIKWRRVLLSTVICIIIIFRKMPSSKEFLLYFFVIFITFYIIWQLYIENYSFCALNCGKKNLKMLGTIRTKIKNKMNLYSRYKNI